MRKGTQRAEIMPMKKDMHHNMFRNVNRRRSFNNDLTCKNPIFRPMNGGERERGGRDKEREIV